MGAEPGFPANYEERVLANVVSEEANARAVLAKVLLGEADAGFVYRTDLRGTDLAWLDIPRQDGIDIVYEGAALLDSDHPADAGEFLAFLAEPRGQTILQSHGFLPPEADVIGGATPAARTAQ